MQKQPISEEKSKQDLRENLQKLNEELQSLMKQKELLINETRDAIDKEKLNWKQEKQELLTKAKEEGYQEGFRQGKEDSLKQYNQLLENANSITESAMVDYHSTIERSESSILRLSIQVAEKIVKQKLSDDPVSFLPIIKAAIKELKDHSTISIYLHPDNYEFVLGQKGELEQIVDDDTRLSLYADNEIVENSCLIQHAFGQIDAGIDTQLEQIRNVLHEIAMENHQ